MRSLATALGLCVVSSVVLGQGKTTSKLPKWQDLKASSLKVQRGKLLVGLSNGGAAAYDLASMKPLAATSTGGGTATRDVLWENNRMWWVAGNGQVLYVASANQKAPTPINLAPSGFTQKPQRLMVWQGKVFLQGESQIRVIDPKSYKVELPEAVLPSDVATAIQQGTILSNWLTKRNGEGEGQMVVVRRYGRRNSDSAGKRDIASLTGWVSDGKNIRSLGTYTRSLVDFKPAEGPRVRFKLGRKDVDEPFGACDPGNIVLSPEGMVALDDRVGLVIPFRAKNWMPDEIGLKVTPKYSKALTSSGANLWWTDGERVFCGSIEGGAVDVYVPKKKPRNPLQTLAADEDGLWILHGGFIKRIEPDQLDTTTDNGFLRYSAGASQPELTPDEIRLREAAVNGVITGLDAWDWLWKNTAILGHSIRPGSREKELTATAREVKSDLQVGDVLLRHGRPSLYIGDGEVASWDGGRVTRTGLETTSEAKIYRLFNRQAFANFTKVKGPDDQDAFPLGGGQTPGLLAQRVPVLGLIKPNPALGHDHFVKVNTQSPYDHPYLPIHASFLAEAESWIGTPYVWGGNSKDGCDCSGFVKGVFAAFGINLPRHSQDMGQCEIGDVVTDELRFGDVLVYPSPKHVAIYIGGGKTIEAVRGGVGYSNVWRRDRAVVRRFITR